MKNNIQMYIVEVLLLVHVFSYDTGWCEQVSALPKVSQFTIENTTLFHKSWDNLLDFFTGGSSQTLHIDGLTVQVFV